MDTNKIQLIGAPCGHHGQYTFYKGFKYKKNGRHKILSLSDFFFVKLWSDSDLISIGELQLLWMDKNSEQVLASLRLYFLPENTPEGRNDDHGEDEVLAISEKVVLRVEDLLDRIVEDVSWCRGLEAVWERNCLLQPSSDEATKSHGKMLIDSALDFQDVLKEREQIADDFDPEVSAVVVLSFPRYCRYRGIMKRLEGVANRWLKNALVVALGGFVVPCRNTRILFCKDTFDYPDLEGHELLCNHLAPNLKGRPRRKRKKRSLSPGGSESNESEESSLSTVSSTMKSKPTGSGGGRNGLRCNNLVQPRRSSRVNASPEEKEFLVKLHRFMKLRQTPIGRVPHLGFKEIDLFAFFSKVQKLGGYNVVTANRMWKPIYDDLGGHQGSTSAATCTRRHYERLLLPYERSMKNDEGKERRRSKSVRNEADKVSASSERTERHVKPPSCTETSTPDNKSAVLNGGQKEKAVVLEGKTSSLRSVRTKPDKTILDPTVMPRPKDKENIPVSNLSEGLVVEVKQEPASEGSASEKPLPELIDLVPEQDSSAKVVKTSTVPALKKRKLEILKEGGLEVTAITPPVMASATSIGSVTITADRRPSVIQHAAPVQSPLLGQVSITVTPDVTHMLGSPPTESNSAASTPSPTADCELPCLRRTHVSVHDLKHPAMQHLYTGSLSHVHSSTPSPSSTTDEWTPPRVTQSRSIYAHSESTVYGNPKDDIESSPGSLNRRRSIVKPVPSGGEVLDLRVSNLRKPAVSISRVTSVVHPHASTRNPNRSSHKTNGVSPFPIIDGRAVVGSNLEITIVDVPKPYPSLQQRQQQMLLEQQRGLQHHRRSLSIKPAPSNRPLSRNENVNHNSLSITHIPPQRNSSHTSSSAHLVIPNPYPSSAAANNRKSLISDGSRSRQQHPNTTPQSPPSATPTSSSMSYLPTGSPVYPGYLPQLSPVSGSSTAKNPYHFPLLDPMYYPALYGSHGLYSPNMAAAAAAAAFLSPLQVAAAPPLFAPSAEQLQLYKDLICQNHNNLRYAQPGASYLGLPRDGSTSITPVGQPTPTSK